MHYISCLLVLTIILTTNTKMVFVANGDYGTDLWVFDKNTEELKGKTHN